MNVIVYGPQGCGKTCHKEALARHFGANLIIDEWNGSDPLPENSMALTNIEGIEGALNFADISSTISLI